MTGFSCITAPLSIVAALDNNGGFHSCCVLVWMLTR
jgi:hypothetical protein